MVEAKFKSTDQILADLNLAPHDVEELCSLERGFFARTSSADILSPKFNVDDEKLITFPGS